MLPAGAGFEPDFSVTEAGLRIRVEQKRQQPGERRSRQSLSVVWAVDDAFGPWLR
jgi:hypothetical protein